MPRWRDHGWPSGSAMKVTSIGVSEMEPVLMVMITQVMTMMNVFPGPWGDGTLSNDLASLARHSDGLKRDPVVIRCGL
jgi:hypothetical protein